jgi:hypothetical protein
MNCFQKVIAQLGLNGDMQDNGCDVAYLLLAALADKEVALGSSAPADTYTNPCKEVLYRLASYKGFALERLARLLGDYAD